MVEVTEYAPGKFVTKTIIQKTNGKRIATTLKSETPVMITPLIFDVLSPKKITEFTGNEMQPHYIDS